MARNILPVERIEKSILLIDEQKVLLDYQLAEMYGVPLKAFNQAVKRNLDRFPSDFMFELSMEMTQSLRSQIVTLKNTRGQHSKFPTKAFTEQGVAMLSSVLRSPQAVQVNIAIMRAFVKLREMLLSHKDLARKLATMESKYDAQFKVVFDAIRQLMEPPPAPVKKRRIGFIQE